MQTKDLVSTLKRFDAYPKTLEDFRIKTFGGGAGNFCISFCNDIVHVLQLDENRCESCYGAETSDQMCCNTCEDVREAYRKKGWALSEVDNIKQCTREGWKDKLETQRNEGCLVTGHLEVNKVAGNFHFAPGKSFQQHHVHVAILRLNSGGNIIKLNMHDLQPFGSTQFNLTHHIRHLSFGNEYPGITHPLDGTAVAAEETGIMYQYFVKIVPTVYRKLNGEVVNTNQFSVTKHKRVVRQVTGEHGLPGVFVLYEFSPMVVQYTENRRSFMHFLTGLCAIVGGIFTVAGLIDSMIYHSSRALQKKIDLGKAT
ncbi:PREDICTED: endoplasmic reticulum-Golgi intermediate compartment protein 3-like [Acropora digitifera]|uniref:endoplasmic reticulum-Golgi intermediate compartment protein 3-like n=1 Tax=Acropora digitifera TaxID=70779 RepID=UPI00077B0147|nr:PREDICTED: endoplasmic reticulum-Golgi intermediate compartment protein 3-like [Acropora digitifera]